MIHWPPLVGKGCITLLFIPSENANSSVFLVSLLDLNVETKRTSSQLIRGVKDLQDNLYIYMLALLISL